jgi:hypothetical protein
VAVRLRARDRLGPKIAAGSGLVVDDEGLAHALGQRLRHEARHDVGRTAGRKADHESHRTRRVIEPMRGPQDGESGRQRDRGKLQKLSGSDPRGRFLLLFLSADHRTHD